MKEGVNRTIKWEEFWGMGLRYLWAFIWWADIFSFFVFVEFGCGKSSGRVSHRKRIEKRRLWRRSFVVSFWVVYVVCVFYLFIWSIRVSLLELERESFILCVESLWFSCFQARDPVLF